MIYASLIRNLRACLTRAVVAGAAIVAFSAASNAITFEVDFSGGANTVIGTFETPMGGGVVSNLTVTLSGVTFDTPNPGGGVLSYIPGADDFTYAGPFASFLNSTAVPGVCAVGGCFMEIYPDPDPFVPGDYLAIDESLTNIDAGTKYIINPVPIDAAVPVPASVLLLVTGVLLLPLIMRMRRSRAQPAT